MTTATYASTATLTQIADRIRDSDSIMLVGHRKPDGDSMGSIAALHRALRQMGKSPQAFVMGSFESNLRSLAPDVAFRNADTEPPGEDEAFDLIVLLDTGAWSQLEPLEQWLRSRASSIVGLDHHGQGDDVASLRVVETSCASTTQLLLELIDELQVDLTTEIAEALFLGLATDTGWFRHSNADARAFATATRLLETGVDKSRLYQVTDESHRPQRLLLEARMLNSMTLECGGEVAVMTLGIADFSETGGSSDDLTGLINTPMSVSTIRAAVLLVQTTLGITKVSFRSKPAAPGNDPDDFIDVSAIAQEFGGGGHVHAAGARLKMDVFAARDALVPVLERMIANRG